MCTLRETGSRRVAGGKPPRVASDKPGLFAELKRRNVLRAAVLYAGAVWALSQGISQLTPAIGLPDWATRWFLIAAVIGFPFWVAFAWFYEFTPSGLKRESEIDPTDSIAHSTGRKFDSWIVGVMALAIVLLLTDRFVARRGVGAVDNPSIAVLPLANESGDPTQQYFSDGLSEDLINALAQFNGLKVISRNSSFLFRESKDDAKAIGTKLGVAHLLEGSVRRAGEEVRISVELVNAADGSTLWSQRYDRPYADLFKLQDAITQAVAGALKTKLLPNDIAATQNDRPPNGNLAAYNAYLQGQFYNARNTEADERKAIDAYTAATQLDPSYALAWAKLGHAWAHLAGGSLGGASAQKAYAQARAAITRALVLQPNLAAAHVARGYLFLYADFDWTGAEAEFRRAVQLAPNDGGAMSGLGKLLATLGQPEQSVTLTRQALETDPLNSHWRYWLAGYLSGLARLDEAERAVRNAMDLQPAAVAFRGQLTIIAIQRGDAKSALANARQEPAGLSQDVFVALAQQISGDVAAADAALRHLIDKWPTEGPYQIAVVYALRRDSDNTFAWLDRAWDARDPGIGLLLTDPFILHYRNDPRFAAFCQKVGLPTTTEAKALP